MVKSYREIHWFQLPSYIDMYGRKWLTRVEYANMLMPWYQACLRAILFLLLQSLLKIRIQPSNTKYRNILCSLSYIYRLLFLYCNIFRWTSSYGDIDELSVAKRVNPPYERVCMNFRLLSARLNPVTVLICH